MVRRLAGACAVAAVGLALWAAALGVASAAGLGVASIGARRTVMPVLGDWEGVAAHGAPLSFVLTRRQGRITLSDLVVGLPEACVRPSSAWLAEAYPKATYIGPGAPPAVTLFARRPNEITFEIHLSYSAIPLPIDGTLRSGRSAVLSMANSPTAVRRCGWPARLTWHVHPAHRRTVKDGTWTGQVAAPGAASAPLTVKITANGRIIDYFSEVVTCAGGGGGQFSAGPGAGEFIAADGSFTGLAGQWRGRFGPGDTAQGMSFDPGACTGSSTVMGPFTLTWAHH